MFLLTSRNPQWPASLLLLFAINQLIVSHLQAVPSQPASELTRQGGQFVKVLTELSASYMQLAQVMIVDDDGQ